MMERSAQAAPNTSCHALLARHREQLQQQYRELTAAPQASLHDDAAISDALSRSLAELRGALQIMDEAERQLRAHSERLAAKEADCELHRRRYRELLESCPDAYIVTDHDGIICEANVAASKLTGRDPEDLIDTHLAELIHPEKREDFLSSAAELPNLGQIEHMETCVIAGDEAIASVAISATMCDVEQRWVLCDVTGLEEDKQELRQMRDEIQRSERLAAIGTLAAGLGHDVKNLLFPMRRRLQSLAAADLSPRAVEDLQGLRHVVTYLQQLASTLQLMAERPDPSQMVEGTTDIVTWWEHVAPLVRTATRSSVQLRTNFGDDLPPLNIAPHLLTQAVMNLVSNAGEVMTDGGTIKVWAKRAKHGPFVRVGVSDTGPGMSPDVLRRALDPFFTTKPRTRGLSTGMGLSLVRSIAKSVAGSVRIDSTPGQGTTVVLRFPVAPEPMQTGARSAGSTPCAAVSVSDSHLAATMCTLLNLSRLPSWRCDPQDPGECNLWIVEPESVEVDMACEFLRADDKRRLVLFGRKSEHWREVEATWIDPSASLANLRDALSEIAFDVLQGQ